MWRRSVILLTVVLAGCGTTPESRDFDGEAAQVAESVESLQEAAVASDEARICRTLLAEAFVERIEQGAGECPEEMEATLDDTDALVLEVVDVKVSGTTATATVDSRQGEDEVRRELSYVKERDDWRLADLGEAGPAPADGGS